FDRFADLFVPFSRSAAVVDRLQTAPEVLWIDYVGPIHMTPPPPPEKTITMGVGRETVIHGGLDFERKRLTGKGVVIAIIDSGVDFRNPDFITYEDGDPARPVSRFLYFWDTMSPGRRGAEQPPVKYPDRSPVGAVYTRSELTAALRKTARDLPR